MPPEPLTQPPVRFDCPACGATLTVPAAAAGLEGPCPKCWQEIVSPDPGRGLPARLPTPPPVAAPEPPLVPPAPPETVTDEPVAPTAGPSPAPRSKARLVLLFAVPALIFAGVGYHFGKGHRPLVIRSSTLSLPPSPPPAAESSPTPAPEMKVPAQAMDQASEPPPPASSEAADAEETLMAFLGAPDWQARSAFVLSPEEIRPAMEKHAKEHGDGPIPAISIQLRNVSPPNHVFNVCTPAMPDGFPVPVTFTDDGPKIDWEAFIGFHDDHFKKLLDGPADRTGILDLLVKPDIGGEENPHYVRFRLSVPMPGRETVAWVRKDSVALARLKAIFDGAGGFDKATVESIVNELGGVPLVMALAKRRTNDGRDYIEIVDMVAVQWGHRGP